MEKLVSTKFLRNMIILPSIVILFLAFIMTPGAPSWNVLTLILIISIIALFFFVSFYIQRKLSEGLLLRIKEKENLLHEKTGLLYEKPKNTEIYNKKTRTSKTHKELPEPMDTFCLHCGNKVLDKDQVICEKCGNSIKE